jgi:Flp pilus assembly protein TadB
LICARYIRGVNETAYDTAQEPRSGAGTLARRVLAWVILVAVAVILLKVAVGIVLSLVHAIVIIALLAVLGAGVLWALRHL